MNAYDSLQSLSLLAALPVLAHAQFHETLVEEPGLGATALLGTDISIHSERAVIGANGAESFEGRARIYDYNPSTGQWEFLVSISTGANSPGDGYGEAVAIHDTRVVVGAPGGDAGGVGLAGYASVHEPWSSNPDIYLPTGVVRASDPEAGARFGHSVAVRGEWVLVGAPEKDYVSSLDAKGAVYVYQRNSSNPYWGPTQTLKIRPTSGQTGERFGTSLDMSSNRAIIGAPRGGSLYGTTGRAYIYAESGGSWSEEDELQPFEDAGDFGKSVSLYSNMAVVGAPLYDSATGSFSNTGAAYVFERNLTSGNWDLVAKLLPPVEGNNLQFGDDVAIDDRRIVVGTLDERAYVFSRRNLGGGNEWFLSGVVEASDGVNGDDYGRCVAAGGEHFAVGARLADPSASSTNGGKAYFYRYPEEFAAFCFANEDDCPCGNDDPHAGCKNSTGEGALLKSLGSGSLSAHDLRMRVVNLPLDKSVILFAGPGSSRNPFQDGLLCVGGGIQRLGVRNSGSSGTAVFYAGQTIDALAPSSGDILYYQAWYRDNAGPCGNGSNTPNAVRVRFGS